MVDKKKKMKGQGKRTSEPDVVNILDGAYETLKTVARYVELEEEKHINSAMDHIVTARDTYIGRSEGVRKANVGGC